MSSGLPFVKRIFDLALAGFLLCFLSIPILFIGLMVKLTSKGPALYNQDDLVGLRTGKGIHKLIPGITGWAQVNGSARLNFPGGALFNPSTICRSYGAGWLKMNCRFR